jgi:hypothetical protein
LLAHHLFDGHLSAQTTAWYLKPQPTFSDAIALVRYHLWTTLNWVKSPAQTRPFLIHASLLPGLVDTLCYAPERDKVEFMLFRLRGRSQEQLMAALRAKHTADLDVSLPIKCPIWMRHASFSSRTPYASSLLERISIPGCGFEATNC